MRLTNASHKQPLGVMPVAEIEGRRLSSRGEALAALYREKIFGE
jgi:hypothetical protein